MRLIHSTPSWWVHFLWTKISKKCPQTHKNTHFPCIIQKIVVSLPPNLRRSRVMRRMVVGSLHIDGVYWRFVFDAQKASNTFNKQVKSKVTIDAYGYDCSCRSVSLWQTVCHIGVGFIVVYLTRWASSKALVRRWAIAKSALSLCMYIQTII